MFFFRECRPGFLIEEYFPHDLELRVATIFGQVIVGASDCGLMIDSVNSGPTWVKYIATPKRIIRLKLIVCLDATLLSFFM